MAITSTVGPQFLHETGGDRFPSIFSGLKRAHRPLPATVAPGWTGPGRRHWRRWTWLEHFDGEVIARSPPTGRPGATALSPPREAGGEARGRQGGPHAGSPDQPAVDLSTQTSPRRA